jgi:hypothetical protein
MTPDGFLSNHAGGILGGISSGQDVVCSVALKPTSSLRLPGRSVDLDGNAGRGRHHRPPRPLRRHPRHADRRGDGGAGADGPGAAPPRPVRRRRSVAAIPGVGRARRRPGFARHSSAPIDMNIPHCLPRCRGAARLDTIAPHTSPMEAQSMSKPLKVAIVGATGAVGEALLEILAERKFPFTELVALASERSAGEHGRFGGASYVVRDLATFDFAGVDIAFFSAGGSVSREHAPRVRRGRCGGDRQHLGLPLRRRRAAGGQPRSTRRRSRPPARHHRQPQLLDHADAGGAGADPPRGRHRAHQRRHLPVGVRRRALGDGGTGPADRGAAQLPGAPSRSASRCRSPST